MRVAMGRQPADWHREWIDAAGPERPGQGVPADHQAALPAHGGARISEHPCDDIGEKEQDPRVPPLVAEDKDLQDRGRGQKGMGERG